MQAIGYVLPLAVALALSTLPIMVALLILLSPNRSRSALPFLIGWVVGMVLVVTLCTLAAQFVPASRLPRRQDEVVGVLEIIIGIALIGLGIFSLWRARRRTDHSLPAWLRTTETLGPWSSFGLALLLNFRAKALLIAAAAGLSLRADAESLTDAVVAIALYTLIGASTVAVPIIASLAAPARMEPRLVDTREWLTRNGEAITAAIVMLIGVVIVAMGIGRL
ncbi:GAP family protein [Microbacterium sp. SS28]|uniref:GAP family protein n=1 Tax=Microbacterium sp. SS28 TaxID=2919948 RepID=UPI001FAAE9B9|nr:GAP family protein [Microbacterium sp. SS28]